MTDHIDISTADAAPELRHGDSGPWVRYLQQLLEVNAHNLTHFDIRLGTIDDDFGTRTETAVKAYQAWMPVAQTGVVDRAVWASLIEGAQIFEQVDDSRGDQLEARGRRSELAPGQEVGREGWCRTDVRCIVRTFRGNVFPDGTQAYIRFIDHDGAVSDEDVRMNDGSLRLDDVWVPSVGEFHLYVDSQQPSADGGWLGTVQGSKAMRVQHGTVQFEATQRSGETITLSQEEATSRGWVTTVGVSAGIDLEIVNFGAEMSTSESFESSSSSGRSITVTLPGIGFDIEPG